MEINKSMEIESVDLMKGIAFHGETYADKEACEKIMQLNTLLNDTLTELGHVKNTSEFHKENYGNASAREIMDQIDALFDDLQLNINEYNGKDIIDKD